LRSYFETEFAGLRGETGLVGVNRKLTELAGRQYPTAADVAVAVEGKVGGRLDTLVGRQPPTTSQIADAVKAKLGQYPTKEEIATAVGRVDLSVVERKVDTLVGREVPTADGVADKVVAKLGQISTTERQGLEALVRATVAAEIAPLVAAVEALRTATPTQTVILRESAPAAAPVERPRAPRRQRETTAPRAERDQSSRLPELEPAKEAKVLARILANNRSFASQVVPGTHDLGSYEEELGRNAGERARIRKAAVGELGLDNVEIDYKEALGRG